MIFEIILFSGVLGAVLLAVAFCGRRLWLEPPAVSIEEKVAPPLAHVSYGAFAEDVEVLPDDAPVAGDVPRAVGVEAESDEDVNTISGLARRASFCLLFL